MITPEQQARRNVCFRLRKDGKSWREIGDVMNIAPSSAQGLYLNEMNRRKGNNVFQVGDYIFLKGNDPRLDMLPIGVMGQVHALDRPGFVLVNFGSLWPIVRCKVEWLEHDYDRRGTNK